MVEARPGCCQESNYLYPQFPCNKPAVRMISWPAQGEGPYRMCLGCADHSVRNRGATDTGPFEDNQEKPVNDVLAMAAADAAKEEPAPEDKLEKIKFFGEKQRKLTKAIADAENHLSGLKENLRRVMEQDLPEAMDEVNMTKFVLDDGTTVTVKSFYSASIPEDRKDEAFQWLKENDFDGLIKADVKVQFGKGEFEVAQSFLNFIRGFNEKAIDPEYKEQVHWQTLRAFVKEQIEGGKPLPLDMFGVFVGRKAELKLPK